MTRVPRARELLDRLHVSVVEKDDARSHRERVRAVRPLLAALGDRVLSAAPDRLQIHLLRPFSAESRSFSDVQVISLFVRSHS